MLKGQGFGWLAGSTLSIRPGSENDELVGRTRSLPSQNCHEEQLFNFFTIQPKSLSLASRRLPRTS